MLTDQYDISRINRNVSTSADSNSYISLHQGWRVIDAIADHCHPCAFRLKTPDFIRLISRKHLSKYFLDAEGTSNGLSCLSVIPGKKQHIQTHPLKLCDGFFGTVFELVRQGK